MKDRSLAVATASLFLLSGERWVVAKDNAKDDLIRLSSINALVHSTDLKHQSDFKELRERISQAYDRYVFELRQVAKLGGAVDEPQWASKLISYYKRQGSAVYGLSVLRARRNLVELTEETSVAKIDDTVQFQPPRHNAPPDIIGH